MCDFVSSRVGKCVLCVCVRFSEREREREREREINDQETCLLPVTSLTMSGVE